MILVFDTSTSQLSIALASKTGDVLAEFHAEADTHERGIHDARLANETQKLLEGNAIKAGYLSRIGLVIGPGSFTGLRIGLSFAKGLAIATRAGIVPITQHEAIAASTPLMARYIVTPGYQANQIYFAEEAAPQSITLMSVEEFLQRPSQKTLAHVLLHDSGLPMDCEFISPSMQAVAKLTARSEAAISGEGIDSLEPLYITEFKPG